MGPTYLVYIDGEKQYQFHNVPVLNNNTRIFVI